MERKTYILGGGISGLIAGYYLGLPVISKDVGGQMSTKTNWSLGPRYFHVDEFSTKLLKDLGIKARKETQTIGYNLNGFCKKTEEFRQAYYAKSRKNTEKYSPKSLSGGSSELQSYDIDWDNLISALALQTRNIISQNVCAINLQKKMLTLEDGSVLPYEELISTIPAPAFYKLCNVLPQKPFNSLPKTFVLTMDHGWRRIVRNFNYVYYAGDEPFHRVTREPNMPWHLVYEFVGEEPAKMNHEIDRQKIWIGQIQDSDNIQADFNSVTFLGRYAKWKHGILTNDVIKKVLEMKP